MQKKPQAQLGHNNIVFRYWRAYGGFISLLKSPYFYAAIACTFFLRVYWLGEPTPACTLPCPYQCPSPPPPWWDTALSVLPNLLGFSLGGYLMWLGVGDTSFRSWLHRKAAPEETSVYMEVSATFVHFVIVQIVALVVAVIAKHSQFPLSSDVVLGEIANQINLTPLMIEEWYAPAGYGIGFFFFVYALLTALEAAFGIFRVSSWQDIHEEVGKETYQPKIKITRGTRWVGHRSTLRKKNKNGL